VKLTNRKISTLHKTRTYLYTICLQIKLTKQLKLAIPVISTPTSRPYHGNKGYNFKSHNYSPTFQYCLFFSVKIPSRAMSHRFQAKARDSWALASVFLAAQKHGHILIWYNCFKVNPNALLNRVTWRYIDKPDSPSNVQGQGL